MIIYKTYFKVVKRLLPVLMIYLGVFIAIMFANAMNMNKYEDSGYTSNKVEVAIFNKDDGELSRGLEEYIGSKNDIVELENDKETLQDALYYRTVEYVLFIPEGFSKELSKGKHIDIEKIQVPNSYSAYYVDNMIDKYLNMIQDYMLVSKLSVQEAVEQTEKMLSSEVEVQMLNEEYIDGGTVVAQSLNFSAYTIMSIVILSVGITIGVFNKKNVKARNAVSPTSSRKIGLVQIICNLLLVFIIVTINYAIVIMFLGKNIKLANSIILYMNIFVCGLVALAIAFLVSNLIKSKDGQTAAANVIALGGSFITGVFIPLEMLDDSVKLMGSFLPTYWFVKVNNEVATISGGGLEQFREPLSWIGIQLLFAVSILVVGLVINKEWKSK